MRETTMVCYYFNNFNQTNHKYNIIYIRCHTISGQKTILKVL